MSVESSGRFDVGVERTLGRVHLQDLETIGRRRHPDFDDAIEPTRTTHRGIEHVFAVRRRHPDDAFAASHAVHLDEQLVQREVFFARAVRATALAADRVELVDEDDAASVMRAPSTRGRARVARRRRRTSRRIRSRMRLIPERRLRQRPRGRAASCRYPAGRRAGRRPGSARPSS